MNIGLETGGIGCTPSSTPSLNENEGAGRCGILQVVAQPKRYVSTLPRPINQPQKGVINWEVSAVDQDKDPNRFEAEKPHANEFAVQDMMATSLSPNQDGSSALCENKKGCKRKKGSQKSRIQLRMENNRVAAKKSRDRVKHIRQQNENILKNHGVGLPVKDKIPSLSSSDVMEELRRDESSYINLFHQINQFDKLVDYIAAKFHGRKNNGCSKKKAGELARLFMPEHGVSVDGLVKYREQIRIRIEARYRRIFSEKYDDELRESVNRLKRSDFSVSERGGSGPGTLINIDEIPGSDNGEMIKPALIDTSSGSGVFHDTDGQIFFDMVDEVDLSMEKENDFH
ncbi:MAG: hypothetical protein ACPG5T_03225, partial [Endozoicomonas sp.]